jgi:hypothetical protein
MTDPKSTEAASAFLDTPVIWSDLASKLTGQREHDLMAIGGFCFAYQVPMRLVLAKVQAHVRPGGDAIH